MKIKTFLNCLHLRSYHLEQHDLNSLYKDKEAYAGMGTIENVPEAKEQIVLNSINVLLKHGIKGLYIYASNEKLRHKLLEDQRKEDENE